MSTSSHRYPSPTSLLFSVAVTFLNENERLDINRRVHTEILSLRLSLSTRISFEIIFVTFQIFMCQIANNFFTAGED
jgi:hypothetical protein